MTRMHIGMMWFDDDRSRPLRQRIGQAVEYYRTKYGDPPNLLFLHPDTRGEDELNPRLGVDVHTSPTVLPDHFWLGMGADEASVAD